LFQCNEYKKAQKEAEEAASGTRKTSRVGEHQEGRLPQVTEGGEDTQTEVLNNEGPVTEDGTHEIVSSSGRMSSKASTGAASANLPYQKPSISNAENAFYPQEAGTEEPQGRSTPATGSKASIGTASAKLPHQQTSISSPEPKLNPQEVETEKPQGRLTPTTGSGRVSASTSKGSLQGRSISESGFQRRSETLLRGKSPEAESGFERKSETLLRGKSPEGGSGKVSSKTSKASLPGRSTPDQGSGKISPKISKASSKTSQRQESAPASNGRQSAGVTAQDGDPNKSKSPCETITLQCRCSTLNNPSQYGSYPKQGTPQAMGYSQYGQGQYGQQGMQYPQEQLGGYRQAQQYRTDNECIEAGQSFPGQQRQQYGVRGQQGQQYGVQNQQGQQYGVRSQQGQQYGYRNEQGQPYGAQQQYQQYAIQGQQGQAYVQYGNEAQQYGNMYQQCLTQDHNYGALNQQYNPQGQQYSTQVQQSRQYGQQSGAQDQQYPGQGAAGCKPCPTCPPGEQGQGPQQQNGASSATAASNRQGAGIPRSGSNPSSTSSTSRKRCSRPDSMNTYDGDEDEDPKSDCKNLL